MVFSRVPVFPPVMRQRGSVLALALWLAAVQAMAQGLWAEEEQRINVGIKLFPACLGADTDLDDRLSAEGRLRVLVVHDGEPARARDVVGALDQVEVVAGHRLTVLPLSLEELESFNLARIAAVFVIGPDMPDWLFRDWGPDHRALVFSPFAGDVERGATAGVFVSDRILPYVNPESARQAGIRFKSFFLRIAQHYPGSE